MTDSEKTLLDIASSVSGAYTDFGRSVTTFAKHYGIIDEMISFIQSSSVINTDDVLDYLDSITPKQEIVITG